MEYQEYIKLGFVREDFDDKIEYQQTGYHGFCLTRKISKKMSISVCSGELDEPKLCINKGDTGLSHSFPISCEAVRDLLSKEESTNLHYPTTNIGVV